VPGVGEPESREGSRSHDGVLMAGAEGPLPAAQARHRSSAHLRSSVVALTSLFPVPISAPIRVAANANSAYGRIPLLQDWAVLSPPIG
jgi:hypothetical protein